MYSYSCYSIQNRVCKWKGLTNPACTNQSCQWNSSAKEICPKKIEGKQLLQHNVGKREKTKLMNQEKSNFDPRPTSEKNISDSCKLYFLSEVRNILPKATLNISAILPQCKDIHPSLEDIAADVMENCTNDQIDSFNSKMSFSDSQIHELEKATRNQSNSKNWWSQRKERITPSRFHEINQKMQMLYENYLKPVKCRMTPLLLSIVEPKELKIVKSLKGGKKNEKNTAERFMKTEGKKTY